MTKAAKQKYGPLKKFLRLETAYSDPNEIQVNLMKFVHRKSDTCYNCVEQVESKWG